MAVTATEAADKWARNLGQAGPSIEAGVNAVTESPMEKAANAADRYLAGVQRSVNDGTYQAALRAVPLSAWKEAMIRKGIPRIQAQVNEAKPKMQRFLAAFLPHVQEGVRRLPPRGDLQQNIARMVAMVQHNAEFAMPTA